MYTLEVDDDNARDEYLRAISLISRLGLIQEELSSDKKSPERLTSEACEKLVERLQATADKCQKELAKCADDKYKAKLRLKELRATMEKQKKSFGKKRTEH
eukprot:UN24102